MFLRGEHMLDSRAYLRAGGIGPLPLQLGCRCPSLFSVAPSFRAILGSNGGEGVSGINSRAHLVPLLFARSVSASRKLLVRLFSALAGVAQADFGIGAKTQLFLAAFDPVFQAPQLAAGRLDQQEQAKGVGQLIGLWPGLRVPNRNICQGHVFRHFCLVWPPWRGPLELPPALAPHNGPRRMVALSERLRTPAACHAPQCCGFWGFVQTDTNVNQQQNGAGSGNRTRVTSLEG